MTGDDGSSVGARLSRTPASHGSRPVRIVACEGRVRGTWTIAFAAYAPSCAIRSSLGVRSTPLYTPTRSARSVSTVTRTKWRAPTDTGVREHDAGPQSVATIATAM